MADPAEDDLLLTAFLDGELSPDERQAMATRLASDPSLRARLEELRQGEVILQSAWGAALAAAPQANMAARLTMATKKSAARRQLPGNWLRAAAIAAVAFIAGVAASRLPPPAESPEQESWRDSVAEYMQLYTAASFPQRDEATLRSELSALSQSVGVDLSDSNLRYGPFAPRSGVLLQFKGAPLAQIGYVADGEPAAFCIIRDGEPDAPLTRGRLGGFNVISWAKSGRGFMFVSAAPAERLDEFARSLHDRTAIN
jgi:anti-sigma factor RsiW